jgi:hypothetical protein
VGTPAIRKGLGHEKSLVAVLDYCITPSHVHLLVDAADRMWGASVLSSQSVTLCGKGFFDQARRERRAFRHGSVRSEQRSLIEKELRPRIAPELTVASLLLGHSPITGCSLVAPRHRSILAQHIVLALGHEHANSWLTSAVLHILLALSSVERLGYGIMK